MPDPTEGNNETQELSLQDLGLDSPSQDNNELSLMDLGIEPPQEDIELSFSDLEISPTDDGLFEELQVVPTEDELNIVEDPDRIPESGIVEQDITSDATSRITRERVRTEGELEAGREQVLKNEEERKAYNEIASNQLQLLPERPTGTFLRSGEGLDEKPDSQFGALGADFGVKLTQEEKVVEYTRDALDKIATMSEEESPNFFQGLGGQGEKLIPFIGTLSEIPELLVRGDVLNKPQDKRTDSEQSMVDAIALLNSFESSGHKPTSYEWGEMVGMMIPFLGEFAATGGVATSVAKTVGKGLIKKGLKKGALNYTLRGTTGAIAQATANPHRYIEGTIQRMTPLDQAIINLETPEIERIVRVKQGEEFGEAATKAYLTQVSEMFTERLGFAYGAGAGRFMKSKVAKHLVNEETLAKYTLKEFAKRKGITKISELKKFTDRVGFQGVLTEVWGEELPNMAINEIITGDSGKTLLESLNPLDEDLLKMVVPTLILQGGMYAPTGVVSALKVAKNIVSEKSDKVIEDVAPQSEQSELKTDEHTEETSKLISELKQKEHAKEESIVQETDEGKKEEDSGKEVAKEEVKQEVLKKEEVKEDKVTEETLKEELSQLVKDKHLSKEGKKYTVLTEEGGVALKRIEEKSKSIKESLKETLTKKISSEKPKQSDYIKRRLAEFKDKPELTEEIEKITPQNSPKLVLAEAESETLVRDFQKELGEVDGIMKTAELVKSRKIPAMMQPLVLAKAYTKLLSLGEISKSNEVLKINAEMGTESAHFMRALQEDAAPEQTVSRAFAGLSEDRQGALEKEFKDGKTYNQVLEEVSSELTKVKEAYDKLLKEGKISDKNLPLTKKKGRRDKKATELKLKGRILRKDGLKIFKAGLKKQSGTLQMGLRIEGDTLKGLAMMLEGYIYEFEGNVLAAYESFKRGVTKEFGESITEKDIDKIKNNLLELSKETIEDFKKEKQRQVVSELLKPKGKETNIERKARAEATKNIVEDFNNEEEDLSGNLSEIAKFENISKEDTKAIMELANKWTELSSDGKFELAEDAWYDLMIKMESLNLAGNLFHEALLDIWYTGVLSGFTTLARSIKGSATTAAMFSISRLLANPKVAPLMISEMMKATSGTMANYAHVVRTGKTRISLTDQGKTKGIPWTKKITTEKFSDLGFKDKILKYPSSAIIYLFRNIPAFDQILTNPMIAGNMALFEFDKTNKGLKLKDRLEKTRKAIAIEKVDNIKIIVDKEVEELKSKGEKIPIGYHDRRVREIRNSMLDQELYKKAVEDAARAALVSTPTGHLGMTYNAILNAIEIKKDQDKVTQAAKLVVKGIIPFIRVAFNWINAGLDYTPIGAARGTFVKSAWTKTGSQEKKGFERREQLIKSAQGAALYTVVMLSMFDWDDDEGFKLKDEKDMWIDVHGDLSGNWWEEKSISKDSQPWSVRFRNPVTGNWTGWMKYRDNPIGMVLAPIGLLRDRIAIKDFKLKVAGKEEEITRKGVDRLLGAGAIGIYHYAMSQSFNQGAKTISKAFAPKNDEDMGRSLADLILKPVGGFYAGAATQMYNQYKALSDIPEKESDTWYDQFAKKIPFIDAIVKHNKYDVFGIPVVRDFDVPFVPDIILKMAKDNLTYREDYKEWKLLWKYEEVTLGSFMAPELIEKTKLTDEDSNNYERIAGENMRKQVNRSYSYLNKLEPIDLQVELNLMYKQAKEDAKYIVETKMRKDKRIKR